MIEPCGMFESWLQPLKLMKLCVMCHMVVLSTLLDFFKKITSICNELTFFSLPCMYGCLTFVKQSFTCSCWIAYLQMLLLSVLTLEDGAQ